MNGYIYKCLGELGKNNHNNPEKKYSISLLCGGIHDGNKRLTFENGAYFVFSSTDNELTNQFLMGVLSNPQITTGLTFAGVEHMNEKIYDGYNNFVTLSPILMKEVGEDGKTRFVTLNDKDFADKFKQYLIKVAKKNIAGFDETKFDVIISDHKGHRVKKVNVGDAVNFGSSFNFKIISPRNVADFFYQSGIGVSRSSGFGTIYKRETSSLYAWNGKMVPNVAVLC
jgi:CRISPR-associated endoribonuclease Cas6